MHNNMFMCFVIGRVSELKQSNDGHVQGLKISFHVKCRPIQYKSQKSSALANGSIWCWWRPYIARRLNRTGGH